MKLPITAALGALVLASTISLPILHGQDEAKKPESVKPGINSKFLDPKLNIRDWIMGHVRAGKDVFTAEIKAAKFEQVKEVNIEDFKENYFLVFKKQ